MRPICCQACGAVLDHEMFDYWLDEETLEGGSLSEMLGVSPSTEAFSVDGLRCFLISFS